MQQRREHDRRMSAVNNRCYLRGWTPLGLLNTVIGCLFNRVLVRHIDTETGKTVNWSMGVATDYPPDSDTT